MNLNNLCDACVKGRIDICFLSFLLSSVLLSGKCKIHVAPTICLILKKKELGRSKNEQFKNNKRMHDAHYGETEELLATDRKKDK